MQRYRESRVPEDSGSPNAGSSLRHWEFSSIRDDPAWQRAMPYMKEIEKREEERMKRILSKAAESVETRRVRNASSAAVTSRNSEMDELRERIDLMKTQLTLLEYEEVGRNAELYPEGFVSEVATWKERVQQQHKNQKDRKHSLPEATTLEPQPKKPKLISETQQSESTREKKGFSIPNSTAHGGRSRSTDSEKTHSDRTAAPIVTHHSIPSLELPSGLVSFTGSTLHSSILSDTIASSRGQKRTEGEDATNSFRYERISSDESETPTSGPPRKKKRRQSGTSTNPDSLTSPTASVSTSALAQKRSGGASSHAMNESSTNSSETQSRGESSAGRRSTVRSSLCIPLSVLEQDYLSGNPVVPRTESVNTSSTTGTESSNLHFQTKTRDSTTTTTPTMFSPTPDSEGRIGPAPMAPISPVSIPESQPFSPSSDQGSPSHPASSPNQATATPPSSAGSRTPPQKVTPNTSRHVPLNRPYPSRIYPAAPSRLPPGGVGNRGSRSGSSESEVVAMINQKDKSDQPKQTKLIPPPIRSHKVPKLPRKPKRGKKTL